MTHHTGYFGATGSGKSTLMKALVEREPRVVIYDAMAEYPGTAVTSLHGVRDEIMKDWGKRFWKFQIAYRPDGGGSPETLHALSVMMRRFFEPNYSVGVLLAVEEMSTCYPVHNLPRELNGFRTLCNMGRHWSISLAGASQRMAEVSSNFRANLGECYALRMPYAADRKAAEQVIGSDHRAALRALENLEYLRLEPGGKVTRGKVRFGRS